MSAARSEAPTVRPPRLDTEGYIVLALGHPRYQEMAASLAASIKVMDPGRPVCLVHDTGAVVPESIGRFFDHMVELTPDSRYPHVMNKIRIFDVTPYRSTMFVDADCLMVRRDIDRYWQATAGHSFSITGAVRRDGEWKGVQIAEVLRQEGADYLIQMNAGVFHFDNSPEAEAFFRGLETFYLERMERLNVSNYKGPRSQSFELYLGLYMGLLGMRTDHMYVPGGHSWMVSTWRAVHCAIDPARDHVAIYKGDHHLFGLPFLPRKVVRLSPTFAHFIALKPRQLYERLAREFREQALQLRAVTA